jgi:hypothetical protein
MKIEYAVDPYSQTFSYFKQLLENEVTKNREQNDADLSDVDTAKLRGRIQLAKHLLGELKKYEGK